MSAISAPSRHANTPKRKMAPYRAVGAYRYCEGVTTTYAIESPRHLEGLSGIFLFPSWGVEIEGNNRTKRICAPRNGDVKV